MKLIEIIVWPVLAAKIGSAVRAAFMCTWGLLMVSSTVASPLQPDNAQIVTLGSKLYITHCSSCHGIKLEGQANWRERLPNGRLPAPPHDKTGHTWHHNDKLLFKITKFGTKALAGGDYETDMQGYKDVLSDDEIISVLSYIKSTWPEQIKKRHDRMNEQSQR